MKIREALRMRAEGLNNSQIASNSTVNCARSTVVELFKRSDHRKITYASSQNLSDRELEALLYPRKQLAKPPRQALDEAYWIKRTAESGKTIMDIWQEEYLEQGMHSLSYGQFCHRLKQWQDKNNPELNYPKQRKAGEVMETDWCGDKIAVLYCQETRSFQTVHFFVAVLGFSQKIFARAYLDERQAAWINAHTKALEFYGAVPLVVKPDNTKTAILKPHRYEADKNPAFARWAAHYGIAIIPARAAKPKDKDRVEDAVGWFEKKVLPKLKEQIFFDLAELNRSILIELKKLNNKPYQKRPGNRADIYQEVDLPAMRPLPAHAFENPDIRWVSASRKDYHVHFDGHQYSVPYQLAGEKFLLSATGTAVELLYDNKRIALHHRCYARNQLYITDPHHMPEKHHVQHEVDGMTGETYRQLAAGIGPHTKEVMAALLAKAEVEQEAYTACLGVLRLARDHSPFQLEKACQTACRLGIHTYRHIKELIAQEEHESKPSNAQQSHANIRGGKYYTGR